eukprot:9132135-Pyramimonas_sp.AAC.1
MRDRSIKPHVFVERVFWGSRQAVLQMLLPMLDAPTRASSPNSPSTPRPVQRGPLRGEWVGGEGRGRLGKEK